MRVRLALTRLFLEGRTTKGKLIPYCTCQILSVCFFEATTFNQHFDEA